MIPNNIDVVITHEPPIMILDQSSGIHWGNAPLRNRILEQNHATIFLVMPTMDMVY